MIDHLHAHHDKNHLHNDNDHQDHYNDKTNHHHHHHHHDNDDLCQEDHCHDDNNQYDLHDLHHNDHYHDNHHHNHPHHNDNQHLISTTTAPPLYNLKTIKLFLSNKRVNSAVLSRHFLNTVFILILGSVYIQNVALPLSVCRIIVEIESVKSYCTMGFIVKKKDFRDTLSFNRKNYFTFIFYEQYLYT